MMNNARYFGDDPITLHYETVEGLSLFMTWAIDLTVRADSYV